MAARKKVAAPPAPRSNPHSWLAMNYSRDKFGFGVLERTYLGRSNSAAEFVTAKLQPTPPLPGGPGVTAERVDVALPRYAVDRWRDPLALAADVDVAAAISRKPELFAYATLYFPAVERAHHAWREAWRVADHLAEAHDLATIVVEHIPARAGSRNPIHHHLLIVPRHMKPGVGLGAYHRPFCSPRGADVIHALWLKHRS